MSNHLHQTRVLVTGASEFMGSWLTELLIAKGAIVTTLLADWNPESYFVRSGIFHRTKNVVGSITDFDCLNQLIRNQKIQAVFHLAAISVEGLAFKDPCLAFEINVRGTYNVLEACRVNADQIQQVIVASSDKAYGDSPILPYTEELPTIGRNPYDVSKSCADMIARSYYHSYGLPVAVIWQYLWRRRPELESPHAQYDSVFAQSSTSACQDACSREL